MLITIKSYRDSVDAHLDKGFLEAQGIECHLKNDEVVAANWLYSQALGGIELQVHQEKTEEAMKLLEVD